MNKQRPYVLDKPNQTKSTNGKGQSRSDHSTPAANEITKRRPAMTLDELVQSKMWAHQDNAAHPAAQPTPSGALQPCDREPKTIGMNENGQSNQPNEDRLCVEQVSFSAAPPKPQLSMSGQNEWDVLQTAPPKPPSPTGDGHRTSVPPGRHRQIDGNVASDSFTKWELEWPPQPSSWLRAVETSPPLKATSTASNASSELVDTPGPSALQHKVPPPTPAPGLFIPPTLQFTDKAEELLPTYEGPHFSDPGERIRVLPRARSAQNPYSIDEFRVKVLTAALVWSKFAREDKDFEELLKDRMFLGGYRWCKIPRH